MYKREVTSSEPRDYMEITGKGLTKSLDIRTKISKKNQKERFSITDITFEKLSKFPKKFNNLPYLSY